MISSIKKKKRMNTIMSIQKKEKKILSQTWIHLNARCSTETSELNAAQTSLQSFTQTCLSPIVS